MNYGTEDESSVGGDDESIDTIGTMDMIPSEQDLEITKSDRQVSFRLYGNKDDKAVTEANRPRRRTATTAMRSTRRISQGEDRFICDSGGGTRPTITERAWKTIGETLGERFGVTVS